MLEHRSQDDEAENFSEHGNKNFTKQNNTKGTKQTKMEGVPERHLPKTDNNAFRPAGEHR